MYLKVKIFSVTLPPTSGSKGVTEINGEEHVLSFDPHFIYEEVTSLYYCKYLEAVVQRCS